MYMSCAGKGYGTSPQSNFYLNAQFYLSIDQLSVTPKTRRFCRKYRGFYPSFTPTLGNLSVTSSPAGNYSLVYVTGSNFLPDRTTIIKFGNNDFLPVTYYSSFNLSFVVPSYLPAGNYNVRVVNIYNGNFSPQINRSYPGNYFYSNSMTYTIT